MTKTFSLVFTGLSGSGKTTLAKRLTDKLAKLGVHVQFIDGDEFRNELGNLFGYTRQERMKQNRIARTVMRYLNRNGVNVIFTLVAPYKEMRQCMRESIGVPYIEIYAKCSLETCARRDVKGYYKKQREGAMQNLNGADDVFELPEQSEIIVDTEDDTEEACVAQILLYLREHGYIEYKYITENNLENQQDYMYSAYHGETFLEAYRKTRKAFSDVYEEGITQEDNFLPVDVSETEKNLSALACKLVAGQWTEAEKREMDFFVKAFEVRKRLYDEYELGKIRPIAGARYDGVRRYLLLAECTSLAYKMTTSLVYLNTMLKVDDTLLSLVSSMTRDEQVLFAKLLRREMGFIHQWERMAG